MKRQPPKGRAEWVVRRDAHLKAHPTCALRSAECWGPVDAHHIEVKGMGGVGVDDSPLATLCRKHHDWVHSHPKESRLLGLLKKRGTDA